MEAEPEEYYNSIGYEEWTRSEELFVHSVEHENTYPYLEKHLPEQGHVLDAGGAAGKYTVWLAEKGYKVTLVDISQKQLDIAQEKLEERGLLDQVEIKKGDIRDLEFEEESFDAVLCLGGPLSHVINDEERENAAEELLRVVKTDHPVFVSVMGFYACLMLHVLNEWSFVRQIEDFHRRQKYDEKHRDLANEDESGFANTYFFKSDQLENLLERNGLDVAKLVGLENVVSVLEIRKEDEKWRPSEEYRERLRTTAKMIRDEDAAPDLSNHILAVGWKKPTMN